MDKEISTLRLTGGIYLGLMLHVKSTDMSSFDMDFVPSDSALSEALFKVWFPEFEAENDNSFRHSITEYKNCTKSYGKHLPFNNQLAINNFRERIEAYPEAVLSGFSLVLDKYIKSQDDKEWLVRALLDIIEKDDSIAADQELMCAPDLSLLTKSDIFSNRKICAESFLLGIWAFIVMERSDNTLGADTYNILYEEPVLKGTQWRLKKELFSNDREIDFLIFDPVESSNSYAVVSYESVPRGTYAPYIEKVIERYSKIKTLLYKDEPHDFYAFYVPNYLNAHRKKSNYLANPDYIEEISIEDIYNICGRFSIICGTGGLGKSMMLRHLLLDAAKKYDKGEIIPVFVPLKDFTDEYDSLLEYIHSSFIHLGMDMDIEQFKGSLLLGEFLILLDGLDEIGIKYRSKFEREIDFFTNKYNKNYYVISSRPYTSFAQFTRFQVCDLLPFTPKQSMALIQKLDFRPDEPGIKEKFLEKLRNELFLTHRSFTENPLLLTIMLLTFEQYAEIPSQMYVFYREAYEALAVRHDASKGAYKRPLLTGVTSDQFAEMFAEFCARTYMKEKYELTREAFEVEFNELTSKNKFLERRSFDVSDFINDLISNICLMYYEDGKYQFVHRSFQEYFCALHFSKAKPENIQAAGIMFNQRKVSHHERFFDMLYDMIPEKVEEYIFVSYLESLFEKYDIEHNYFDFILAMYPYIEYEEFEDGHIEDHFYIHNRAEEYLYQFILEIKGIKSDINMIKIPFYSENVDEQFYEVLYHESYNEDGTENVTANIVAASELPSLDAGYIGEPELYGYKMSLDMHEILECYYCDGTYSDIIDLMQSEDFAFKKEFRAAQEYLKNYKAEKAKRSVDIFDLF